MKRTVGWLLIGALALVFAAISPTLLVFTVAGAIAGAIVAAIVVYSPRRRQRVEMLDARSVVGLAVLVVSLLAAALGLFSVSSSRRASLPPALQEARPPLVRPVQYEGTFKLDEAAELWAAEEVIAVPRAELTDTASSIAADPRREEPQQLELSARSPAPRLGPHGLLGPRWRYLGKRGPGGQVLVFRRKRSVPVEIPTWPPTADDTIRVGSVASPELPLVLVPADGSQVEIRAPEGFVREIDSPATERHFSGDDVFILRLSGLENSPDRRNLQLRIAGGIGRSSVFAALESVSAWTLIKVLFAGLPALIVGYFAARWLKKRFPEAKP